MQGGEVRIVVAKTAEELAAVRELFLEYADSLGWDLTSGGRFAEEIETLPGPYAPPCGALLLAYVGDEPAGALGLEPVPEDARIPGTGVERFGELKRLFVRSAFRRCGVGAALIRRAEDEARERGYEETVLTTSAEMFPLAQGLYESLGYGPGWPYRNDMPWPGIRWMRKVL
jgi:GNAT superfamily N-acetyltransferase